jgi:hypothetical protein
MNGWTAYFGNPGSFLYQGWRGYPVNVRLFCSVQKLPQRPVETFPAENKKSGREFGFFLYSIFPILLHIKF